jgi:NADH/NAD ratio-sensing transcriptional regulator Rex
MIDDSNNIILPEPTLRRLPWYLAYIDILKANGVETVSSTQISKAISVDSSQIAKDLSFLNTKGKTRIGYEVDTLSNVLSHFLGFKEIHNAFIVGVGSLGAALIHDTGLSNYGLNIIAGFDINPDIIGKKICDVASILVPNGPCCQDDTSTCKPFSPFRRISSCPAVTAPSSSIRAAGSSTSRATSRRRGRAP